MEQVHPARSSAMRVLLFGEEVTLFFHHRRYLASSKTELVTWISQSPGVITPSAKDAARSSAKVSPREQTKTGRFQGDESGFFTTRSNLNVQVFAAQEEETSEVTGEHQLQ
jgi:hypothetical protein